MTGWDKDFAIERYRYILEQKKFLNKSTFVIVSIYQAGLALIVTAKYHLWKSGSVSCVYDGLLLASSRSLSLLLWVLALFSVSMLISGIFAWRGYRVDEAIFEERYLGVHRPLPRWASIFSWYETYAITGIALVTIVFTLIFSRLTC